MHRKSLRGAKHSDATLCGRNTLASPTPEAPDKFRFSCGSPEFRLLTYQEPPHYRPRDVSSSSVFRFHFFALRTATNCCGGHKADRKIPAVVLKILEMRYWFVLVF